MIRKKKLKKNRQVDDNTPVSAMIDIVFLLLIYFILTQKPIIEDTLLKFSPATGGGQSSKVSEDDFVMLEVKSSPGSCSVNGQSISINELPQWLEQISRNTPLASIVILCGEKVKHHNLVAVMDICRKSPLKKINIVAK